MPFKSEAQRRFMFSQHPDIAKRWVAEGKGNVVAGSSNTGKGNLPPWLANKSNQQQPGAAQQPSDKNAGKKKKHSQTKMDAIARRMQKNSNQKG